MHDVTYPQVTASTNCYLIEILLAQADGHITCKRERLFACTQIVKPREREIRKRETKEEAKEIQGRRRLRMRKHAMQDVSVDLGNKEIYFVCLRARAQCVSEKLLAHLLVEFQRRKKTPVYTVIHENVLAPPSPPF